jgi:hypothetical protein
MVRSFVITVLLTGLLLTAAGISTAAESEARAASNIGFVLYSRSPAPGTLNARWIYGKEYRGPGIATGGPKEGFAGKYHVRYFLEDGKFSDEYDLVIERSGDVYSVSWISEGKLSAIGVGMEVEDGLAVGWRRVAD